MANPIVIDQEYEIDSDEILNDDLSIGATLGNNPIFSSVTLPLNGTLNLNTDGTFTLTPDESDICSVMCFQYKVVDNAGTSNIASTNTVVNEVVDSGPIDPPKPYYVSNSGNDSNDGLTPTTPWATWQKVYEKMEDLTIGSGDSIKFKCGDTFLTDNANNAINQSYDAVDRLTLESYGIGAKPILKHTGTEEVLRIDAGTLTKQGLYFKDLVFDPDSSSKSIRTFGKYNYITIERCENISSGNFLGNDMSQGKPSNHTIINNIIRFGGVYGGSDNYINSGNHYLECNKDNDGSEGAHAISITGTKWGHTLSDLTISNNIFENSSRCLAGGKCCSSTAMFSGILEDVLFEKNIFLEDPDNAASSCTAILVNDAHSTLAGEMVTRLTVQDNLLLNVGESGIILEGTIDSIVRRNTIVQTGKMDAALISLDAGEVVNDNVLIDSNDMYIEEDGTKSQVFIAENVGTNITVSNNSDTFFSGNDSNFVPVVFDHSYSLAATGKLFGNLADFAIVNQTGVTYAINALPTKGTLSISDDGSFNYDPTNKAQSTVDSFTYYVNDNGVISNTKSVNLTVTDPKAISTISAVEDDNMCLVSLSQEGVPKIERKNTTYAGPWTFAYRLTGSGGSDIATVTVHITGLIDGGSVVAVDDSYDLNTSVSNNLIVGTLGVLSNDTGWS